MPGVIFWVLIAIAVLFAISVLRKLNSILERQRTIMATQQQMVDALKVIDTATTKAAGNIQSIADTTQTISTEVDALVEKLKNLGGVPDELLEEATALGARAQAVSDGLDAIAPALQAIATKGADNPVPVPIPG